MNALSFLLFFSLFPSAHGTACQGPSPIGIENFKTLSRLLEGPTCKDVKNIKSMEDLRTSIGSIWTGLNLKLGNTIGSRHEVGEKLNDCTANANSKGLLVNFAGTGSFNPKGFNLLAKFIKCAGGKGQTSDLDGGTIFSEIHDFLLKTQKENKSSGFERAAFQTLYNDASLREIAGDLNVVNFASEEYEFLESFKSSSFNEIVKFINPIREHSKNTSPGIRSAIKCIQTYMESANAAHITPKLIFTSHSSGATAIKKVAETLSKMTNPITGEPYKIDLVFTIDPVKAAHKAISNVIGQLINPVTWIKRRGFKVKSESLFVRPQNVSKWVSFFQFEDEWGLYKKKLVGICGGTVKDGENCNVSGLGPQGHGAIATSRDVVDGFTENMKEVFNLNGVLPDK